MKRPATLTTRLSTNLQINPHNDSPESRNKLGTLGKPPSSPLRVDIVVPLNMMSCVHISKDKK